MPGMHTHVTAALTTALAAVFAFHAPEADVSAGPCTVRPDAAGCRAEPHPEREPHRQAPAVSQTAAVTGNVSGNVSIEVPVGSLSVTGQAPDAS